MSVSILNKPQDVDFTKNELKHKINGTGYISDSGSYTQFYFVKIGTLTAGDLFKIPVPGDIQSSIQIYARAAPLPNELTAGLTIEGTAEELNNMKAVSDLYVVTVVDITKLMFTAKEKGSSDIGGSYYFIGTGYQWSLSYVVSSGSPEEYVQDYFLYAKLSIDSEKISEQRADPDSNSNAVFEFGDFFKNNPLDLPDFEAATEEMADAFANYEIEFREFVNGAWSFPVNNSSKAFVGKVQFNQYPEWDYETRFFANTLQNQDTFEDGYHFLYFYDGIGNPVTLQKLKVRFHYTDGTNDEIDLLSLETEGEKVYFVNASFRKLSPLADVNKTVHKYDIYGDYPIEIKISFTLKAKPIFAKQYLFRNDFGFYETVNIAGIVTESQKVTSNIFKKNTALGYSSESGEFSRTVQDSHAEFEQKSGSKYKSEAAQLRQIIRSEDFYLLDFKNQVYTKLEIISDSMKIAGDDEYLFDVTFSYRYSFDN